MSSFAGGKRKKKESFCYKCDAFSLILNRYGTLWLMFPGQECSVRLWVFSKRLSGGVRNAQKVTALFSVWKGSQVRHFQTPDKLLHKCSGAGIPQSAVSLWQWKVPVPTFQEFCKHAAGNACFPSLSCYSRKDGLMACSFIFALYPAHVSFLLNLISSSSKQLLLSRVLRAVEQGWNESRAFLGQLWGLWDSWLPTCRSLNWMFAIIWPSARFCLLFFFKTERASHVKGLFSCILFQWTSPTGP